MKKKPLIRSLIAALLALALVLPVLAADWTLPDWSAPGDPVRTSAVTLISQSSGEHVKYMEGSGGWFHPEQPVTRAELAQMLSRIAADTPVSTPSFYDVPAGAWYAPAVQKAAGLGLMTSSGGAFRPDDPATRAECAAALSLFIPYDVAVAQTFPDVTTEHAAWHAIVRTASYGLFHGDDAGFFHPDDPLKRCEVTAVFNRLLGRTPDTSYLADHPGLPAFPDVPPGHWAYADVMEATVTHRCTNWLGFEIWTDIMGGTVAVVEPIPNLPVQPDIPSLPVQPSTPALADGPQRIDGRLYWVSNGEFIRNQNMSGLHFDENGCYTTGNAELDDRLNAIVEELTNDSMTRDEKLRVLFNYCRDNFKYLKRPLISKGQTGWEPDYALYFLKNGKGNCYNFSATYCLLCRELGLPAYCVVGSALNSPHGWVEIVLDGNIYLFDPQLAWRYLHDWGKTGYNFFKQPITKTTVKYTW